MHTMARNFAYEFLAACLPDLKCRALLIAAFLACLANGVAAEEWPARPIKFLVPLAAGSTADILSRMVGERLSKVLGQPFLVDDKPGAVA